MTLRSLSASESCRGVAGGGKGESGLGEEDTHSEGFMSWRLRQKAATCSVLCKSKRDRTVWYDKLCNSNLKAKEVKSTVSINQHRRSTSNMNTQVLLSTYWCAWIHDCAESEPGKRQRGSSKKIICTNLVYFQSVITMTLRLSLFHSHRSFPWCFPPTDGSVVYDDSSLFKKSKYTHNSVCPDTVGVAVETSLGVH